MKINFGKLGGLARVLDVAGAVRGIVRLVEAFHGGEPGATKLERARAEFARMIQPFEALAGVNVDDAKVLAAFDAAASAQKRVMNAKAEALAAEESARAAFAALKGVLEEFKASREASAPAAR